MRKTVFTCLFVVTALLAKAQEPISTDRPDQSDGVYVMPAGAFQLETGLVFSRDLYDSLSHSSLLRYGVFKGVELRLVVEESLIRHPESTRRGFLPFGLATKIKLWEQQSWLPAATFSGYLRIPSSASPDFVTPYYGHTGLVAFQYKAGERWVINQNTGLVNDGLSRSYQCFVTGSVTFEPVDHLILLAEYFAYYQPQQAPDHRADLGVLYQLNDNVQLDLDYGRALYDPQQWFITAGFSFRIIPGTKQ